MGFGWVQRQRISTEHAAAVEHIQHDAPLDAVESYLPLLAFKKLASFRQIAAARPLTYLCHLRAFPFGGWTTVVLQRTHVIIEEIWVRFAKYQRAIPICGLFPLLTSSGAHPGRHRSRR
jgi:hypothetical protein